jgi:hypothetical protein
MQAVRTSETSVYVYETTLLHIPEGCYIHTRMGFFLGSVERYLTKEAYINEDIRT